MSVMAGYEYAHNAALNPWACDYPQRSNGSEVNTDFLVKFRAVLLTLFRHTDTIIAERM